MIITPTCPLLFLKVQLIMFNILPLFPFPPDVVVEEIDPEVPPVPFMKIKLFNSTMFVPESKI